MELTLIKNHLNLDNNLDDNLLTQYEAAAEHAIASYIHTDYDATNKALEQAKLLLISDWYNFREDTIALNLNQVTNGVRFLLDMEMSVAIWELGT